MARTSACFPCTALEIRQFRRWFPFRFEIPLGMVERLNVEVRSVLMLNGGPGPRTAGIAAGVVIWLAQMVSAQPLVAQRSDASTQCRRMLAQKASQLTVAAVRARESCHQRP